MATRAYTVQTVDGGVTVTWTGLLAGDDGAPLSMPFLEDKTIHIKGVFGGATARLEGSNDGGSTYPNPLTDQVGAALSGGTAFLKLVAENPGIVRPFVNGGDGTTNLTAILVCR